MPTSPVMNSNVRRFPSVKDLTRKYSTRSIEAEQKRSTHQEKLEKETQAKTMATAVLDYGAL